MCVFATDLLPNLKFVHTMMPLLDQLSVFRETISDLSLENTSFPIPKSSMIIAPNALLDAFDSSSNENPQNKSQCWIVAVKHHCHPPSCLAVCLRTQASVGSCQPWHSKP